MRAVELAFMKLASFARVGLTLALTSAFMPVPGRAETASNPKCSTAVPDVGEPQLPLDDEFRVANLNVLHGLDDDGADYPSATTLDTRIQMQAAQLAGADVDLVGMQEVSVFRVTPTSPLREVASDLAEALAETTGQRWWWCWYLANPYFTGEPDLNDGGGGPISDLSATLVSTFTGGPYAFFKDGVAVLSRYEIADAEGLHLPPRLLAEVPLCIAEALTADPVDGPLCAAVAGFERRSALWVRTKTPKGIVDLTTTHLAHHITAASNASSFQQGVAALAFAEAQAAAGAPDAAFFTCDCNAQPGDDVPLIPAIEAAGWTNTFDAACAPPDLVGGCTAGADAIVTHGPKPSRVMTERLDYVFAQDATTCAGNGHLVVNAAVPYGADGWLYPSDHIGVAADIESICY